MKKGILTLIILMLFSCSEKKNWNNMTPTFDDFSVSKFCNLSVAESNPKFSDTNLTIEERKEIRKQYLQPNSIYNCEYSIISIQQNDESWKIYIFSARNGKFIGQLKSEIGILFSKQSSLIIIDPADENGTPGEKTEYWITENDELQKIK